MAHLEYLVWYCSTYITWYMQTKEERENIRYMFSTSSSCVHLCQLLVFYADFDQVCNAQVERGEKRNQANDTGGFDEGH